MTDDALDLLFRKARSQHGWLDKPVSDGQLRQIYELMKWGPTSVNSLPARIVFARTPVNKERIRSALLPSNVEKTMSAPVVAIFAYDSRFYEHLPKLFPENLSMRERFAADAPLAEVTAFRNGTLQGGYFILAARAVGLDCGPMSGFDNAKIDAEFFPDGRFKSNFLCGLGYGDPSKMHERPPRFTFEEVCKFA
jgi:3-hydroxypropanoate dehydrogenase